MRTTNSHTTETVQMESRRVRRSPGLRSMERGQQIQDDGNIDEMLQRLDTLSIMESPARSRTNSSASQTSQASLRTPRPRPLSYHHPSPVVDGTFQSTSGASERQPHSPISQPSSTPASQGMPRTYATPTGQAFNAPAMVRAHSSPISLSPTLGQPTARSGSPLRSPNRVRSPFRPALVEEPGTVSYNSTTTTLSPEIGSILEDAELEIVPRSHMYTTSLSSVSNSSPGLVFPRPLRRRPASPLRSFNSSRASSVPASPHLTATTPHTPFDTSGAKFNETFPTDMPYYYPTSSRTMSVSSSMPSTPTSIRSRSPSISSLETIPDSPDAEVMATVEDSREREERKRLWEQLYGTVPPASSGSDRASAGSRNLGSRDKRKRWSVCGAEKRSDLNLETIWED